MKKKPPLFFTFPDVITPKSFPEKLQEVSYDPFGLMPKFNQAHPRVLVTLPQIERAQTLIKTQKWAAQAFSSLKRNCRPAEAWPTELPVPSQPSLNEPIANQSIRNALAFRLTRQKAYRQRSLQGLRLLANGISQWPVKPCGSQIASYCLGESRMHIALARAYDLLAGEDLSPPDDKLFREMLLNCLEAVDACPHYDCSNINTWSQAGRIAIGLALGDAGIVHDALYGCNRKGQWRYGLIHMLRHDVLSDGMHWERTPGYHYYTLMALTEVADMLQNNGVDLWHAELPSLMQNDGQDKHRAYGPKGNKCLKAMFDAPFYLTVPNGDISLVHDSGLANLRGTWIHGIIYSLAYEAYGDPKYAWLLNRMEKDYPANQRKYLNLPMPLNTHAGDIDFVRLPRASYPPGEFDRTGAGTISLTGRYKAGSALFPVQGAAVLAAPCGETQAPAATLNWAPHCAGHMSPSALHLDIWGAGRRVTDAPRAGGYTDPYYLTWIRTTIAHNTVTVDESSMFPIDFETESVFEADIWRDNISDGELLLFQPDGQGFRAVRAMNDNVYPGVRLDRTVVVTDRAVLDVYRAISKDSHQYDWAVHGIGKLRIPTGAADVKLGTRRGYRHIEKARQWPVTGKLARLTWSGSGVPARACIVLPERSTVIVGHDPLSRLATGELEPVSPRQVAIVRAKGTQVLFMTLWTFGDTRSSILTTLDGDVDGEINLETQVDGEIRRWALPFAPEPVRCEVSHGR